MGQRTDEVVVFIFSLLHLSGITRPFQTTLYDVIDTGKQKPPIAHIFLPTSSFVLSFAKELD